MKNKLFLNDKGRNHIKVLPLSDAGLTVPTDDAEKIRWCKSVYTNLKNRGVNVETFKNRAKGYLIGVWELDGLYYLIQSIRNFSGVFVNTIYISKERGDLLSIAKFLKENADTIMDDYKQQIWDARNELLKPKPEPANDEPGA